MRKIIIILFLISISESAFSQDEKPDFKKIYTEKNHAKFIEKSSEFCQKYKYVYPDSCIKYVTQRIKKINSDDEAKLYKYVGDCYWHKGELQSALEAYAKGLKYFESINDSSSTGLGQALGDIGYVQMDMGLYPQALISYDKALKLARANNDKEYIAIVSTYITQIYYYMGDYRKALQLYVDVLPLFESDSTGNKLGILLLNIGATYGDMKINDSALIYYKKATNVIPPENTKYHAVLSMNMGAIEIQEGRLEEGKILMEKARKHFIERNATNYLAMCNSYEAQYFAKKGNYNKALQKLNLAKKIYEEENSIPKLRNVYNLYSEIYAEQKKFDSAYYAHQKYKMYSDSIEQNKALQNMTYYQVMFETEKKDNEIELLNKEKELNEIEIQAKKSELKNKENQKNFFIGGLVLFIFISAFVYNRYKLSRKQNTIIESKKMEVEQQKQILEVKNMEIMQSIQYAKRIQTAILPPDKLVESYMQDSFVLYMPKDIVSGDFYWMHPTDNNLLFAAVDCTGHGVPGAFMSIVGYNQLNKMVAELKLTQPGEILTNLNKYVADSLHQEQYTDVKDGMDISLCLLDKKNMRLEYAGANNPLYIIRNGELIETKADKMAIGSYYFRDEKFYTNHVFELQKGDCVYLFTDGYADQFGGDRGKKYTYKRLREILLQIHEHSMDKQKQELIANFEQWRNSIEQIDDVCVIGLRI